MPAPAGPGVVQYFEGSRYVGERKTYLCGASVGGASFSGHWPHLAFFCTECGQIWGRAIYAPESFAYAPLPKAKWKLVERGCPAHGRGNLLDDTTDLTFCSHDLLFREAFLLLFKDSI